MYLRFLHVVLKYSLAPFMIQYCYMSLERINNQVTKRLFMIFHGWVILDTIFILLRKKNIRNNDHVLKYLIQFLCELTTNKYSPYTKWYIDRRVGLHPVLGAHLHYHTFVWDIMIRLCDDVNDQICNGVGCSLPNKVGHCPMCMSVQMLSYTCPIFPQMFKTFDHFSIYSYHLFLIVWF